MDSGILINRQYQVLQKGRLHDLRIPHRFRRKAVKKETRKTKTRSGPAAAAGRAAHQKHPRYAGARALRQHAAPGPQRGAHGAQCTCYARALLREPRVGPSAGGPRAPPASASGPSPVVGTAGEGGGVEAVGLVRCPWTVRARGGARARRAAPCACASCRVCVRLHKQVLAWPPFCQAPDSHA